jgi:hypothetical protein
MSFDYDDMIVDYDNDILTIIIGGMEYEYPASQHTNLIEGYKGSGRTPKIIGSSDESDEDMNTDEYDEEYYPHHENKRDRTMHKYGFYGYEDDGY